MATLCPGMQCLHASPCTLLQPSSSRTPPHPAHPADGELSNDDFLLDYGFLPAEQPNPSDAVQLAWADGELLQSACGTAGVRSTLT